MNTLRHHPYRLPTLLLVLVLTLTSCLSTEVEFDLRDPQDLGLTMRYHMDRELWDLGVFDGTSPERAIPVSERDARETALRYTDVTLSDYSVRTRGATVTVTVVYRAGSTESLQKLWGTAGGGQLALDSAQRRVHIPMTQYGIAPDEAQRDLIFTLFDDHTADVTIIAPGPITSGTIAGLEQGDYRSETTGGDTRFSVAIPMRTLAVATEPTALQVSW